MSSGTFDSVFRNGTTLKSAFPRDGVFDVHALLEFLSIGSFESSTLAPRFADTSIKAHLRAYLVRILLLGLLGLQA